jgi:stage II sporulation protein M
LNYFPNAIINYLRKNIGLYVLLTLFFIAGIITGSVAVNMISDSQLNNALNYFNGFIDNIRNIDINPTTIFYISSSNNLKLALIIVLFGLTFIGVPFILALIFFRGFILGFTVAFIINQLGAGGVFFAFLSILPQNVIIIPSILSLGVTGVAFSISILKNRRKAGSGNSHLLGSYILLSCVFSILLVLGGLVEGYISPIFIKVMTQYM